MKKSPCKRNDAYAAMCTCRDMLDVLAQRWTALAIGAMEEGPQRFGQLRSRLEGISPKVLTQTLRRLEDKGLVIRTVYAEVPARVEYELTPLVRSAAEPLSALRTWAEMNSVRPSTSV
ncbi:winged helix-turn-helix transcriptional regulator [Corynebacterium flavescens]|uniref:winged helix-turn-helix transcriptional regulator n=1 Tax=Corynebacterium flavescens TaxID=28028 RepID=UPI002649BE65|nr:helix-turn-helix domain-containing protein [Corynebacterium flavescens]MDN6430773.1 helix-turn-helix transcriptional regulator [Corynebacterium flavescens]MDN6475222.1 helix-turn-helix transcriptional regulator [Corynebacterium flavescens]MDN6601659.1 helix-turn-helix transcriptional regulator [Corynebacterium flavescens]MDN6822660.1 helix-turn-helix transcriptional regulator [Corynebacterium flavescens]